MNLYDHIPNNVNLSEDKRLQRALEKMAAKLSWLVARHGARRVSGQGRLAAHGHRRRLGRLGAFRLCEDAGLPLGNFLEPAQPNAKVGFGDNYGAPAYQEVPGEFRNSLRRIIVTQEIPNRLQSSNSDCWDIPVRLCMTCAIFFR